LSYTGINSFYIKDQLHVVYIPFRGTSSIYA